MRPRYLAAALLLAFASMPTISFAQITINELLNAHPGAGGQEPQGMSEAELEELEEKNVAELNENMPSPVPAAGSAEQGTYGNSAGGSAAKQRARAGLRQFADQRGLGSEQTLLTIIGRYLNVALSLSGIVMVVLFVYAGYLWFTAQDDKNQVAKALMIMKNTVTGAILLISAYAIAKFVITAIISAIISKSK